MDWSNWLYGSFSNNVSLLILVLTFLVHLFCAIGVARDSNNFTRQQIPTQIISPPVWVMASLLGGIIVLALYWAMHHSTLARR